MIEDHAELRTQARRGVAWNYLSSGAALAGQIAYTVATARLVSPSGFGAYAAAQALIGLMSYFTLTSLGLAVIRHPNRSRSVVGTAHTLACFAGVVAAAIAFAGSHRWADLWHAPGSEDLVRIVAIGVPFVAFSAVPVALLRTALRYRDAALIESGSQLVGMIAAVTLTSLSLGATGLAIGQVTGVIVLAFSSAFAARRELNMAFAREHAAPLLSFAAQVSGQSLVYYGIYTLPAILISRMNGSAVLGFYSRANVVVAMPLNQLTNGLTKALYPLYPTVRYDRKRLGELVEYTLDNATLLLWPCFAAVAGSAGPLVAVVLGKRWELSGHLLPVIAAFGAINLVFVIVGNPIEALGHLRIAWAVQCVWLSALGAAAYVSMETGASSFELLSGVLVAQIVAHFVQLTLAARRGFITASSVARIYLVNGGLAVVFLGLPVLANQLLRNEASSILLAVDTLLFMGTAIVVARLVKGIRFSSITQRVLRQSMRAMLADS